MPPRPSCCACSRSASCAALARAPSRMSTCGCWRLPIATPTGRGREGHLRADLFYRLNVFNIHMPPLRDHMEDLPAMAEAMLEPDESEARPARLRRRPVDARPHDGLQLARQCPRAAQHHRARGYSLPRWRAAGCRPPAARLRQTQQQATLASDASSVPVHVGTTVDEAERLLILRTLEATGQNKTRAAEILGVSLKTLHNKLKEYSRARQEHG